MYNEKIFETSDNWELLNAQIWEDNFDYEFFKDVAKDTFEILFELKDEDNISKDLLVLLLKINTFSVNPVSCISAEADAAKLVAQELCGQFSDCWVGTENGVEKSVFIVCAENGIDCFIDTKTFDLTELIDNRLDVNNG